MPSSNISDVFAKRTFMIFCLVRGIGIDVGIMVADTLEELAQTKKGIIGFPFLLTSFLIWREVPVRKEQTIKHAPAITARYIDGFLAEVNGPEPHPMDDSTC